MRRIRNRKLPKSRIWLGMKKTADGIYSALWNSALGSAFTNYDGEQRAAEKSFIFDTFNRLYRKINIKALKSKARQGAEQSLLLGWLESLVALLLGISVRGYGAFALGMSLLSLPCCFIMERSYHHLVFSVVLMITSLPLLLSKKSMAAALCDSSAMSFMLFRLLCLERRDFKCKRLYGNLPTLLICFAAGLLFGAATFFKDPWDLLMAVVITVVGYTVIVSPESGLMIYIAFLPFWSQDQLHFGMLYILVCYILKVMLGKRTLKFELNDYAVLCFALLVLLGSAFSIDTSVSLRYSAHTLIYTAAYFVVVNTIKTRRWAERITWAIIWSLVISVILGLLQRFAIDVDFIMAEELLGSGAVHASFDSSGSFAQYLVLTIFFIFAACLRGTRNFLRWVFMLLFSVLTVVCLFYTLSPWAMVAFILAAVIFFLIYSNRTLIFLIISLLALPFAKYILPLSFTEAVKETIALGQLAIAQRLKIWEIGLVMARDNFLGGSGSGTFSQLYNRYAAEGMESLASAENIYLQTVTELGIFGLLIFVLIIIIFTQSNFSFFARRGGGKNTVYAAAGFSGIFGILVMGIADNIWQSPTLAMTFWLIMGLSMAMKRQYISEKRGYNQYLLGGER